METEIRVATEEDLERTIGWLKVEDQAGHEGCFYCNRRIIRKSQAEGKLTVLIDSSTQEPIAFQTGWDILAVKFEHRRQGFGEKLTRHCLDVEREGDVPGLLIQCEPQTSVPFWNQMGFTQCSNPYGHSVEKYAYMIFDKRFDRDKGAPVAKVSIQFFPENYKWDHKIDAPKKFELNGARTSENFIALFERITFFDQTGPADKDIVIRIEVDGAEIFCDKAKYGEAKGIGVQRQDKFFYLDSICLDPNV